MTTYLACVGTRPEIIKMAPVYRSLKERGETVQVLHTGQHDDMAHALYRFFEMGPDYDMHIERKVPSLSIKGKGSGCPVRTDSILTGTRCIRLRDYAVTIGSAGPHLNWAEKGGELIASAA